MRRATVKQRSSGMVAFMGAGEVGESMIDSGNRFSLDCEVGDLAGCNGKRIALASG